MSWLRTGWNLGANLLTKFAKPAMWIGGGLATATVADQTLNGGRAAQGVGNFIKGGIEGVTDNAADVTASAGSRQTFSGLYNFLAEIGMLLKLIGVGGGIPETLMGLGNSGVQRPTRIGAMAGYNGVDGNGRPLAGPGSPGGPSGSGDSGIDLGQAAMITGGAGVTALAARALLNGRAGAPVGVTPVPGGAAGAADDALSVMQRAQTGGTTAAANAADDVARAAVGAADDVARVGLGARAMGFLSRMPVVGKWVALGTGVTIAGAGLMSGEAEAATPNAGALRGAGATAPATTGGVMNASTAELTGVGLSIVGGGTAATAVATAAAPVAAQLGLRAIPGISSIIAAGDTIYNTSRYALQGEFGKAGLSLVSGVGETVAGLGGAATYLTLGTAWREAVRAGGAAVMGEENTIDHSYAVQGVSALKNFFFGAATNEERRTATAPAPALTQNGMALGFGS